MHDADVLEKTGILGIIRHTWKMTNFGTVDPKSVHDKDVKKILDHVVWRGKKLQIPLAKKIHKRLAVTIHPKTVKSIVITASDLAARGIVTERIASRIQNHLNQKQKNILKEQLTLSFLQKFN